MKEIGAEAFHNCKRLRHVSLNEGLEKLGDKSDGGVFISCPIESIKLPSTLMRIETMTFFDCKCLKRIEIPDGVKYIERHCFEKSGLQEISLPYTLKKMGAGALRDCK